MTEQDMHDAVLGRLQSVLESTDFDLFVAGGPGVDFVNRTRGFVMANVCIDETYKASIERGPGVRRYQGYLEVGIFVPDGQGVGAITALKTDLDDALMSQYIGLVEMRDSEKLRPREIPGWYGRGVMYQFRADNLPS